MFLSRLCLVLAVSTLLPSPQQPRVERLRGVSKVRLEVEIEEKGDERWVKVWVVNDREEAFSFQTGASGGPGGIGWIEPVRKGDEGGFRAIGTAPTCLPDVTFYNGGGYVVLRPPAWGGPTRRSMRPATFDVEAGGRKLYCQWAALKSRVPGEPGRATMEIPDGILKSR
ncbi:MAG: hypothetical protein RL885_07635 [Planctomycetota bacterium]